MALSATGYDTSDFGRALVESGYIHAPLPLDTARSLEAEAAAKPVLERTILHSPQSQGRWRVRGEGSVTTDSDAVLAVSLDLSNRRATGSPNDPDYALYGHSAAVLDLKGISLENRNRIEVDILPICPGNRAVSLNLSFINANGPEGEGYNVPTGAHLIPLRNYQLNRCFLEIADFRRDAMKELSLSFSINGRDMATGDLASFRIVRVEAQTVPQTEQVSGWQPARGHIIYSMTGYDTNGRKTAVIDKSALAGTSTFEILEASSGRPAYSGRIKADTTTTGVFGLIDFSSLNIPGTYRISAAGITSEPFNIDNNSLWDPSCWKILNFIFCQRCGYPVPGVHSTCHTDLLSVHNGLYRPFAGGWHDAGDLSQQTLQTADVAFSLLELYDAKRKSNPLLAYRLREEALWGIEFVLRNRFGDGFHASSVGLLIWQDGILGSSDDIKSVRVQDISYDNYLYAAYEAFAADVLKDDDPMLAQYLAKIAAEDYAFACAKFTKSGYGGWINPYEHTFCTSESQHAATASWAASMLYKITGTQQYADDAARHARYVLDSRCDTPPGDGCPGGFFFRTPDKRSAVHFIHQSREQLYMLALTTLCRTQPSHPDYLQWHTAIEEYSQYLKFLMQFTAPYGMLPSGIYRDDEPSDSEAFFALHLFPPADAENRFKRQASSGVKVAPGYFVRRFPVWFNIFNGNLAVHTSMGKAAALCANFLHDRELIDIAREQLYWVVGKNPFAQSLIYGEGHRYPELNNFSSGNITGAIPVGIRSLGDDDTPYWPQINNACYKEVWLTSAGKWLSLIAETELYEITHETIQANLPAAGIYSLNAALGR